MGRNVSALIGKSVPQIPEKCKDPGTFSIPCIIGNSKFDNAVEAKLHGESRVIQRCFDDNKDDNKR